MWVWRQIWPRMHYTKADYRPADYGRRRQRRLLGHVGGSTRRIESAAHMEEEVGKRRSDLGFIVSIEKPPNEAEHDSIRQRGSSFLRRSPGRICPRSTCRFPRSLCAGPPYWRGRTQPRPARNGRKDAV